MFGEARHSAELDLRHLVLVLAGGAMRLLDLPLDRQAVAVQPERSSNQTLPSALAGDHVLEDLVERVADVDSPLA